ncbi:MAG: hypothetical protein ACRDG3_10480 [Tepidiformaceae bacterium]
MPRRLTRRTFVGLLGVGAAGSVAPVALGWHQLFADAASSGPATKTRQARSPTASPTFIPPPGSTIAGPAEEITFSGSVDRVLGTTQFIGSGQQFKGVTVDLSQTPASKIYPKAHLPYEGDDFYSNGHWLGAIGNSVWQVEFVDFNIYHVIGALSTSGMTDPGSNYTMVDSATQRRWQLDIRAANIGHFTIHGTSPTPTDALLAFPDGTGADIIGYEDRPARPGVLVVTFLEAHP